MMFIEIKGAKKQDGTDETSQKYEKIIDGMKCYTVEQITAALEAAGFGDVKSYHYDGKPWIAVIASKCRNAGN